MKVSEHSSGPTQKYRQLHTYSFSNRSFAQPKLREYQEGPENMYSVCIHVNK